MFALHARVHACTLVSVLRDAFTSNAAGAGERDEKKREKERGGGVGEVHIVLVLIYAARPAFLLPRYRDLSAANYTFTPFLAPSTLEHRKTRMILLIPPPFLPGRSSPPPGIPAAKAENTYASLLASPSPLLSGWLLSFELSRSILSRWVKNKPSLTSA